MSVSDRRVSYAPHDWPNSYVCVTVGRSDMSKFTAGSLQGAFTVNNERTVLKYFVGIPSRPKCVCKFADWFSSVFSPVAADALRVFCKMQSKRQF